MIGVISKIVAADEAAAQDGNLTRSLDSRY
jgi:hypothetical protein